MKTKTYKQVGYYYFLNDIQRLLGYKQPEDIVREALDGKGCFEDESGSEFLWETKDAYASVRKTADGKFLVVKGTDMSDDEILALNPDSDEDSATYDREGGCYFTIYEQTEDERVDLGEDILDKISDLAELHYNLFHRDLICRAIQDKSIPRILFLDGLRAIAVAEQLDNDEFVPIGWENV